MVRKNQIGAILVLIVIGCASASRPVTHTPEAAASAIALQLQPHLQKLSQQKPIYLAIIPFGGPKGKPTPFGKKMSALLQSKLISADLTIIEREQIEKILQEKNLAVTGLTTEKEYMQAGTIAGDEIYHNRNHILWKKGITCSKNYKCKNIYC